MIAALIAKKSIRDGFKAMERHDIRTLMKEWDENAVFIYPGTLPVSKAYDGKTACETFFRTLFDQFPIIKCSIRHICVSNMFDFTGNNVLAVIWDEELINREGYAFNNSVVTLYTLKNRKLVRCQDYFSDTGDAFRKLWETK